MSQLKSKKSQEMKILMKKQKENADKLKEQQSKLSVLKDSMSDFLKKSEFEEENEKAALTKTWESRIGASTDNSIVKQSSVISHENMKNYIKVEEEQKK